MKYALMLKQRLTQLMSYLLAQDVPTFTQSIAAGVRKLLMSPLQIVVARVATSPPRLLICLTVTGLLLLGALIISM